MVVFSIYLGVSEGMAPANLEIVASAVATADHHRLAYIILGDWIMTARTINESGIVQQVLGRLMVPAKATCITTKSAITIDMAMIHQSLAVVMKGPCIREEIECYPHRGLGFLVAGPTTKPMASELARICGPMQVNGRMIQLIGKVASHMAEVRKHTGKTSTVQANAFRGLSQVLTQAVQGVLHLRLGCSLKLLSKIKSKVHWMCFGTIPEDCCGNRWLR